jgi:hypothetical protein
MNLVLLVLNYSVVFVSKWCNPFCGSVRLVDDHGGPHCAACLVYKVFCCVWHFLFICHSQVAGR